MKKIIIITMFFIIMLSFTGCKEYTTKLEKVDKKKIMYITEEVVELINQKKYEEIIDIYFEKI